MTQASEVGKLQRDKQFMTNCRRISMRIVANCKLMLLRLAKAQS
jgi:hypothetical protein